MKINKFNDPKSYHTVEAKTLKSYSTPARAELAAEAMLGAGDFDASCTVVVSTRADGRFVPVCILQGRDAVQAACAYAGSGFMVFA